MGPEALTDLQSLDLKSLGLLGTLGVLAALIAVRHLSKRIADDLYDLFRRAVQGLADLVYGGLKALGRGLTWLGRRVLRRGKAAAVVPPDPVAPVPPDPPADPRPAPPADDPRPAGSSA